MTIATGKVSDFLKDTPIQRYDQVEQRDPTGINGWKNTTLT